ncbi:MAG: aspartate kinase, partial [Deltaproteobacteria bacterium]|nr:aspartate kinase [Deltaproteobacteria bacterium]
MKVIKIGGGCLRGKKKIAEIVDLLPEKGVGNIVVVSALYGITDILIDSMSVAIEDDSKISNIISRIKSHHMLVARHLIHSAAAMKTFGQNFNKLLAELERLYYGLNFIQEITPKINDVISSFGERLSALLLSSVLRAQGAKAIYRMPHDIGIITDGKFGDAAANLKKTGENFQKTLLPMIKKNLILFIPGFYGVSERGDITAFGRGGSDYSAAVIAMASGSESLEVWKDVDGFLSADPKIIPESQLIPELSYDEAAELSYFGAKILHPRTVEPLRKKRLIIAVKNTLNPDVVGSVITHRRRVLTPVVKSVAYTNDIGILKVHSSGVGARLGILSLVSGALAENEINIKSVVTSQTCISLLLALKDLEPGRKVLMGIKPRPFRRLEKIDNVALISVVGEGLSTRPGIAAKCFTATAGCNVNVEMIAFGPSRVALYFIVQKKHLRRAVAAIHSTFFSSPR